MDSFYKINFNKDIKGMEYYGTRKTYFHENEWGELSDTQVNDLLSKGKTIYWGGCLGFHVDDDVTINLSDIDEIIKVEFVPKETKVYTRQSMLYGIGKYYET